MASVLKADACKRSPGDQYLFVNKRFIKSNYLNHAVRMGYEQLLAQDQYRPILFFWIWTLLPLMSMYTQPKRNPNSMRKNSSTITFGFCVKHALGKYLVAPPLTLKRIPTPCTKQTTELRRRGFTLKITWICQSFTLAGNYKGMERSATADPSSQQLTLESGMGSKPKWGIFALWR